MLRALQERISLPASRVLILGAGGSARAVAFALAQVWRLRLYLRTAAERGEKCSHELSEARSVPRSRLKSEFFDAIVNATPVGMYPKTGRSPLSAHELNCRLVFDLIYRPLETKLLQLASRRGIETVSGLEMFLAQGIAQWEIWTGQRAPAAAMRQAVLAALRTEAKSPARPSRDSAQLQLLFLNLRKEGNLVPVYETFTADLLTPVARPSSAWRTNRNIPFYWKALQGERQ